MKSIETIYTVNVTKEDIDEGRKSSYGYCPVALACKRSFEVDNVWVSPNVICESQGYDPFAPLATTPTEVWMFIKDFDNGNKVKPFKFVIRMGERKSPPKIA